jgi:hypothetical protein
MTSYVPKLVLKAQYINDQLALFYLISVPVLSYLEFASNDAVGVRTRLSSMGRQTRVPVSAGTTRLS